MTKTIYKVILLISAAFFMSGCRAWLSVDSEDRILEEELFKDTDGFYTALNGIYIDLVNGNLYSGTFGPSTPDILAQYYNTGADNHTDGSLALYQNEAKRLAVDKAWTRAYLMILNVNKIIEHCDISQGVIINDTDYNIIKGECLGLRALLHFELFRYFGPVFTVSPGATSIPYMDTADPQVKPVLKAVEASERILEDLAIAQSLLEKSDPVRRLGKNNVDSRGRNIYGYRNLRLNYFAVKALLEIPDKMREVLKSDKGIAELSRTFTYAHNFIYLGRGFSYPVALEGALKLKEISYIHAEGYPAAEMKHGPIALIDTEMPVVFIATKNAMYEKILSNVQEIKARKGRVLAVVTSGDKVISAVADNVLEVPETLECLDPLLVSIPLQLLAYHIAVCKGKDVDRPRNLAKSVTVE